jgi:hypothetical protein
MPVSKSGTEEEGPLLIPAGVMRDLFASVVSFRLPELPDGSAADGDNGALTGLRANTSPPTTLQVRGYLISRHHAAAGQRVVSPCVLGRVLPEHFHEF